jgi:3-methyladenine DNA glycosylase AlkD
MHEKEFFIRKAIGWSLRELAKTDSEAVREFVLSNPLSALSKKEALKHI